MSQYMTRLINTILVKNINKTNKLQKPATDKTIINVVLKEIIEQS